MVKAKQSARSNHDSKTESDTLDKRLIYWKRGKYKTKSIKTTNNDGETIVIDIYDFKNFNGTPKIQLKLMQDAPSEDQIKEYEKLKDKVKPTPQEVKKIRLVTEPRRSLVLSLYGNTVPEQGLWLNLHAIKTKRRTLVDGSISESPLTWDKLLGKNGGIQSNLGCRETYPEFDALGSGEGLNWIRDFRGDCDNRFGKNRYKVVPYGAANFNRAAIPFVGIAVSDLGRGDEFFLRIGNYTVSGRFNDFENFDGLFGRQSELQDCIGWFDDHIVQNPNEQST